MISSKSYLVGDMTMAEMYTAQEDITETLEDGRVIQIAVKGGQMPMTEARRLGLVKDSQHAGPSETKEAATEVATTAVTEPKKATRRARSTRK